MDAEGLETLKEALRIRQRKEELERAVGRAARNRHHDFQYYLTIVSELRDLSRSKGVSIDRVAEGLLQEEERRDNEGDYDNDPGH